MAKRKRVVVEKESKEVIPHPRKLREKFTPSSVEQSGLGPAFFAVVAAIIILLLLSIWGGYQITGFYGRGSASVFKEASVSFTQFSGSTLNVAGYSGRVNGMKVEISTPPGSALTFRLAVDNVRQVFLVTKKIDPDSLPVGSVVFYDGYSWKLFTTRTTGNVQSLPLFSSSTAKKQYGELKFEFTPDATSPTEFAAFLKDYRLVSGTAPTLREVGVWKAKWTNGAKVLLTGTFYDSYDGKGYAPVTFGFDSSTLSRIIQADSRVTQGDSTLTIRYAFDPRWG